jgi:hypothetical protein
MDKIDFQIADNFCEEALVELQSYNDISSWIINHKSLYESISIKPEGLPSIGNQNHNGVRYHYIGEFHFTYEQKVYEEGILNYRTQYGAIVYFIERMNINKINELLDPQQYSDKDKPCFIELLNSIFEKFKQDGTTRLYSQVGVCKGCNFGCKGYSFVSELDGSHIDLVLEDSNDRVKDIYDCSNFASGTKATGKRLNLDPDNFPF